MNDPMDTTMAKAKRDRENAIVEKVAGTPNPKDRKAPRSILKGKIPKENDEETMKKKEDEETDDYIADPPNLKLDKGEGNDEIRTNLDSKFEEKDGEKDEEEKNDEEKQQEKKKEGKQAEENDDKMDEDKYCLDLQDKGYKKHTSEWKKITEGVMNNSKVLVEKDEGYIKDHIEDVAKEMKYDLEKMDKDDWRQVFLQTKDVTAPKNKRRFIRIFGVSLARSNPKELFSDNIFDGKKLLLTNITMVWAAAYNLYGPGWRKEMIDLGKTRIATTEVFKKCTKVEKANAKPFTSEEVFDDNQNSLHNLEISMKKICKVKAKNKEVIDPIIWSSAMKQHFTNPKVRKVCLRLAKTPVDIFKTLKMLEGNELDKTAVTSFWMGAYQLLGQEEAVETATTTPKVKAKATNQEPSSEIKFTEETKVAKKPGNRLFISKAKPKTIDTNVKISKRTFNGFYKAKLPTTINPFGPLALAETTAHFSNLTEAIWAIDKKAEVLPWYDNNSVKPLVKGSSELKTKEQLTKYTPNVYIEQGKNTWIRFHIAHDVKKEKFVDTEAFTNAKLQVSYDKVQAKKTSIWGWMLGGIPETANLNDMKEACEAHPLLKDFQIEARSQVIRVFSGKQDTPVHLQVKAIHIIGDDRLTAKGRKAFNQVFGSRNDSGYPQQRVMRFVPNTADNRFPSTQGRVKDVIKMMGKQKKLLKDAKVIYTDTICSLHYYVDQIGYTLCQILMSMRSANEPDMQLFMAVDERTFGSYAVAFTVHKDRMAEATALIPLLNIVMEAKFGPRIWEWFTDTAKDASQGYVYDQETGRLKNMDEEDDDDESSIESEDNEFVLELSESLNISSAKNTGEKGDAFDLDLSFMLDVAENPKNQYGDSGSVKTFKSTCKKPIDVDSSDDEDEEEEEDDSKKTTPKEKEKTEGPGEISITSQTQETSTISDSMANPEQAFAKMCLQNPELLMRYLKGNPEIQAATSEPTTLPKTTDTQKAIPTEEDGDECSL
jgi:hypothetical protein